MCLQDRLDDPAQMDPVAMAGNGAELKKVPPPPPRDPASTYQALVFCVSWCAEFAFRGGFAGNRSGRRWRTPSSSTRSYRPWRPGRSVSLALPANMDCAPTLWPGSPRSVVKWPVITPG